MKFFAAVQLGVALALAQGVLSQSADILGEYSSTDVLFDTTVMEFLTM